MSKLIDALSETGLRTGEILPRAEIHRRGKRHRAVHLYLFNSDNQLLMQRRASTVDHAPGALAISMTAHVDAGEYSSTTVRREVEEELGIPASHLRIEFLFSFYQEAVLNETYIDRQFNDIYVARINIASEQIRLDRSEVTEVAFVPFDTFHGMVADETSAHARVYGNEWRDMQYFLSDWFANRV